MADNDKHIAIGVDIGGSHISCGAVDLHHNSLIPGTCFGADVDNKASANTILTTWAEIISKTIDAAGRENLAGIGFAMPGPFDYTKGIALFEKVEKYLNLYGVHVGNEIRSPLELPAGLPVRFINDATAFAIAEAWIGVGKGIPRIIALTLGTGFGSAFIADGIPVLEGDTVPEMGCVWHLPFGEGIADDYFSTRWFQRSYLKMTGKAINGVKEIAELFDTDQVAHELLVNYGNKMGEFLAPWIRKFGASHIVIGGNITGAFDKFGSHFLESLKRNGVTVGVSLSVLKENAAIIGSARLVDDQFYTRVEPLLSKM
jgi:glucokinase